MGGENAINEQTANWYNAMHEGMLQYKLDAMPASLSFREDH